MTSTVWSKSLLLILLKYLTMDTLFWSIPWYRKVTSAALLLIVSHLISTLWGSVGLGKANRWAYYGAEKGQRCFRGDGGPHLKGATQPTTAKGHVATPQLRNIYMYKRARAWDLSAVSARHISVPPKQDRKIEFPGKQR